MDNNVIIKIYTDRGVYYVEDITDPYEACRYAAVSFLDANMDVMIFSAERVSRDNIYINESRIL